MIKRIHIQEVNLFRTHYWGSSNFSQININSTSLTSQYKWYSFLLFQSQKQQLQGEINKNASLHQQHQQTYERLMASINNTAMNANPNAATKLGPASHPAPLPALPPSTSKGPPKPELNITKVETGIVLSWNMTLDGYDSQIDVYHLYAYQESEAPATTTLWKKIGEVRALPLPMACTLTQFQAGSVYHFAVCAVDVQGQSGPFSEPSSINLPRN